MTGVCNIGTGAGVGVYSGNTGETGPGKAVEGVVADEAVRELSSILRYIRGVLPPLISKVKLYSPTARRDKYRDEIV